MSLLKILDEEMKKALKQKEATRNRVLSYVVAQVKDATIDKKGPLTDEEVIAILRKQQKQHDEAMVFYRQGGREDLVVREEEEKKIIASFLPAALSEKELVGIVDKVISQTGGENFGQVMATVIKKVAGRADGKTVARIVAERSKK